MEVGVRIVACLNLSEVKPGLARAELIGDAR